MIAPAANAEFVWHMEDVLSVYTRPYDPAFPQVCLDEKSIELHADSYAPLPMRPGDPECIDYEYKREGVCNLFMACEPLAGRRVVAVAERRTKVDFAHFLRNLLEEEYAAAERVVLVMDNLNTHTPASLYAAFAPAEARRLTERLEIHHTPKHGSWLNMAEIELSVLSRQCLDRRFADQQSLKPAVDAWVAQRNHDTRKVDWRFTTQDARIKLNRLYPSYLV